MLLSQFLASFFLNLRSVSKFIYNIYLLSFINTCYFDFRISFEIVPADNNENKSPVFHNENSLGLGSWCIQPLYCYVYNRLLDVRRNHYRREEPEIVLRWLFGALLLNPDVSTFWNMKREFIRNGKLNPIEELRFVNIVLYYRAKCFEAFSYRRWILKLILNKDNKWNPDMELLFCNEMQVSSMAANRYGNNCHAWNHKVYLIQLLEALLPSEFNSFLNDEWQESSKWCNRHISDYSGFVYRQILLKKLLVRNNYNEQCKSTMDILKKRRELIFEFVKIAARSCNDVFLLHNGSCKEILDLLHGNYSTKHQDINFEQSLINLSYWTEECIFNEELIRTFPGHEALWYHRRFLVYSLIALIHSFAELGSYKNRYLTPLDNISKPNKECRTLISTPIRKIMSQSLLELALKLRNKNLIETMKLYEKNQNGLADKFFNFLVCMKLEA